MGSCWRISNRVTQSDLHIRKSHSGGELENGLDEMKLQARRPVRNLWRYSKRKVKRVSTMSSKLLIFSSNLSLELQARLFTCLFTSPGGGLIGSSYYHVQNRVLGFPPDPRLSLSSTFQSAPPSIWLFSPKLSHFDFCLPSLAPANLYPSDPLYSLLAHLPKCSPLLTTDDITTLVPAAVISRPLWCSLD